MFKKIILLIILTPFLLVIAGGAWLYFSFAKPLPADFQFQIPQGTSVAEIAAKLKDSGVINSELAFKLYAKYSGLAQKLQAGDYTLPAGLTGPELLKKLTEGRLAKSEKIILIKEGMSNKAIEEYLATNNLISDGSFIQVASTLTSQLPLEIIDKYPFLNEAPSKVDLEGYLFPDTYRLYAEDNGSVLVDKMLTNFQAKVTPQMRADIKAQGKTLYQVLIMASIVEKEVRSTEDMKMVAGIFWNRMSIGMRLESCATLAYLLGVSKPVYSLEDTQINSPYNTYRNDGLPPTPIGNPGLRAIEATIYPTKTDYNFFLSRPDNGETVFARTYEEHLANKNRYLK
jgi:UPF0755 protein